ncbi:MAG: hypothetical protein SOW80_09365 [Anaerovoracaceae bacterium]|nr:hypothetical protein [Anaerovoracaceae bacterium]
MRDLSRRMEEIRRRISRYRCRHEKRAMASLSVVCMALTCGMGILLRIKQQPGMFTIQTEYGTVLLHNGGQAYIVIGVFAFLAGAALTILCVRLNRRRLPDAGRKENR